MKAAQQALVPPPPKKPSIAPPKNAVAIVRSKEPGRNWQVLFLRLEEGLVLDIELYDQSFHRDIAEDMARKAVRSLRE